MVGLLLGENNVLGDEKSPKKKLRVKSGRNAFTVP